MKTLSNREPPIILSEDDIRQTVRQFILAWIRGDITIHFADAMNILQRSQLEGKFIDYKKASERESQGKQYFSNLIETCVGNKDVTSEEREEAISELFKWILILRSAKRVEGRIVEFDIEERFRRLEKRIKALNGVIQELVIVINVMREGRKHS